MIYDKHGNEIMTLGRVNMGNATERNRAKSLSVELLQQTQALTKKDIKNWRMAWQQAINVENPNRIPLYSIYYDTEVDSHLEGCVGQRTDMVMKKAFRLMDTKGNENPEATELFETPWFKDIMRLALQSRYWGHSLIQLGDVVAVNGKPAFDGVRLIPRQHVRPEFGVIVKNQSDDRKDGFDYRHSEMANWCVEAGGSYDLGLFLKVALHAIPKRNMLAFWDQFGEIFGMPIRIAKTASRDPKDKAVIERMLDGMGAAPWGLFPEGTSIEVVETTRGDAFNVYDRRVDRANSEISKAILKQTMTIEDGASRAQGEVHLTIFQNVIDSDADFIRDLVNYSLIPKMLTHGFPLKGLVFNWDESIDYTPEQQWQIETMVADRFDIDPKYFIDKYNIPIIGKKEPSLLTPNPSPDWRGEGTGGGGVRMTGDNSFFD